VLTTFGFVVVNTRGSHCKLRRVGESGVRETLTLPLHDELASGTLHAIYRQVLRFVPAEQLRPHFFTD